MTISDNDLEELLRVLDRGREAWISGEVGLGAGLDAEQDADITTSVPSAVRQVEVSACRTDRRP